MRAPMAKAQDWRDMRMEFERIEASADGPIEAHFHKEGWGVLVRDGSFRVAPGGSRWFLRAANDKDRDRFALTCTRAARLNGESSVNEDVWLDYLLAQKLGVSEGFESRGFQLDPVAGTIWTSPVTLLKIADAVAASISCCLFLATGTLGRGPTGLKGGKEQGRWLTSEMKRRGLTRNRLHTLTGIDGRVAPVDRKTILKAMAGERVRWDLFDRLVEALSNEGDAIDPSEIPVSN